MKHSEIKADIENRFRDIDKALYSILAGFQPGDIHDFRVEVKKLTAFLHMLDGGDVGVGPCRRLPARLRKFYHIAGDIRILQLHRQHILNALQDTSHLPPVAYLNTLDIALACKMQQAEDLLHHRHSFAREKEYIINNLPKKTGAGIIESFIETETDVFWNLVLSDSPDDNTFHQARHVLKNILYTWPYFDVTVVEEIEERLAGERDIASLAHLLGLIHDAAVDISLLDSEYIDQQANDREILLLNDIREQWQFEKELIRQQVCEQLLVNADHLQPLC